MLLLKELTENSFHLELKNRPYSPLLPHSLPIHTDSLTEKDLAAAAEWGGATSVTSPITTLIDSISAGLPQAAARPEP